MTSSETLSFDILIVGAGPAGLSAAIRLKQLCQNMDKSLSICILEKGSEVGAHILSGNVFETRALDELIPDWKERQSPLKTQVIQDYFMALTLTKAYRLPLPPYLNNQKNYIMSLANFCRWLAQHAEKLGIEIYPGFAAAKCLFNDRNHVIGIETKAMGLDKQGNESKQYEPGIQILARHTFLAEGCRGSLSESIINHYKLRDQCQPQTYALGLKEIWEIQPEQHHLGQVTHTVGWPLDLKTYGGSFLYHMENNQVTIGMVVGLDYKNPYLNPYEEMQRLKLHPYFKSLLKGGHRLAYGARTLNEGGWQSIPKLSFPGGSLIGCSAGFLNVPKIKGTHTAMKSGMLAAESVFDSLTQSSLSSLTYEQRLHKSWIRQELYPVRNIRPGFKAGFWIGMINAFMETYIWRGSLPWTLSHHQDHQTLNLAAYSRYIEYPKPDQKITFDRLSSVYLSNTNHRDNQPCHLILQDPVKAIDVNLALYDAPEQRYCPAGVYEIIEENKNKRLQINAQNCLHCKACDIKDPSQNIIWTVPEGGGGPRYSNM